mgnify:CR=1 FL=1
MAKKVHVKAALPPPLGEFVRARVAAGGFASEEEYLRYLVQRDRESAADAELEAFLLEGARSGRPIKVNDKWWAERQAKLAASIEAGRGRARRRKAG